MTITKSWLRLWQLSFVTLLLTVGVIFAQVKVASIGNSITDFSGYTDTLQTLLGSGYQVQNDGVSGRTLMRSGDHPYWTEGKLTQLFAFQPNVITIKLGTNDTKSWNWVNKDQFVADYNGLIDTLYQDVQPRPRIFMVLPVPIFPNNFGIDEAVRANEMTPMLKQVAAQRGLPLIDCFTPLQGRSDLFPDGVHPNAAGADSIANIIYRGLMTTAMIALPSSVSFTASIGESGAIASQTVTISNAAIVGSLDAVQITHNSPWLQCVLNSSDRNGQVITNSIEPAALPDFVDTLYDTVTVSAANARPASISYVVRLITRQAPVFTRLVIDPDTVVVAPSEKVRFTAFAVSQYDELMASQPEVSWSTSGATISADGEFSVAAAGQYYVAAAAGAVRAQTLVIVSDADWTPLSAGRVTEMLQLQDQTSSPHIPIGDTDYQTDFTGQDATMKPVADATVQINGATYRWKRVTMADGVWSDDDSQSNFITYNALYLYSPKSRQVSLSFRHDDDFMVLHNGAVALNDPGWMHEEGADKISRPITLSRGVNLLVFKLHGGFPSNFFSVTFLDSHGGRLEDLFVQFSPDSVTLPPVGAVERRSPNGVGRAVPRVSSIKPGVIRIEIATPGRHEISVTTLAGRRIDTRIVEGAGAFLLQDQRWGAGAYIVRVTGPAGSKTVKRIVHLSGR